MLRNGTPLGSQGDEEVKPDLSPMIDCVFILLIFFIVTTVFVKEPKVSVDDPFSLSSANLEKNSIIFAVTAESQVFYDGRNIGVQGVRQVVQPIMLEKTSPDDAHVIIKGDVVARTGMIDSIADECIEAGVPKYRITYSTR